MSIVKGFLLLTCTFLNYESKRNRLSLGQLWLYLQEVPGWKNLKHYIWDIQKRKKNSRLCWGPLVIFLQTFDLPMLVCLEIFSFKQRTWAGGGKWDYSVLVTVSGQGHAFFNLTFSFRHPSGQLPPAGKGSGMHVVKLVALLRCLTFPCTMIVSQCFHIYDSISFYSNMLGKGLSLLYLFYRSWSWHTRN